MLTSGNYNTEEVRKTVIGLARDLRGIAFAFNTMQRKDLVSDLRGIAFAFNTQVRLGK